MRRKKNKTAGKHSNCVSLRVLRRPRPRGTAMEELPIGMQQRDVEFRAIVEAASVESSHVEPYPESGGNAGRSKLVGVAAPPSGPGNGDAPQGPACYGSVSPQAHLPLEPPENRTPAIIQGDWELLDQGLGLSSAGAAAPLFPPLKWASVEKANTLAKAKALPAVRALSKIFADAGFAPSVNFNVGSGELSLTVPLFLKEGHVLHAAGAAVVGMMLAAMPEQTALEAWYAASRAHPADCAREAEEVRGCIVASSAVRGDASGDLLANRCIAVFAEQTGVGIWQRVVDVRTRTMKLSFAKHEDLIGGPRKLLQYSACYTALMGLDHGVAYHALRNAAVEELQDILNAARETLISDMLSCFWENVAAFPYVATPSLTTTFGQELRAYLASGLGSPTGGFVPTSDTQFSFFLYGGAGTGKSTMVAAMGKALQATLRRFMAPDARADIVKVPLNGHTPETLGAIMRVQGISDMSVERLIEQTVQKGGVAILHLEEVPEDPALQTALVTAVKNMLAGLMRRYPMHGGNVIIALTSNYPAAPALACGTTEISIVAPTAQQQWQHCVAMLENSIKDTTRAHAVAVELKYKLPLLADLRPLCQWWTTLAYHISQRVKDHVAAHGSTAPPRQITAALSSANGGGMVSVDLQVELWEVPESPEDQPSCVSCGSLRSSSSVSVSDGALGQDALRRREGREEQCEFSGEQDAGDEEKTVEPCMWGGWGVLARGARRPLSTRRRQRLSAAPLKDTLKSLLNAFLIDDDTLDPWESPIKTTLPSVLHSQRDGAKSSEDRCGPKCEACASVGNIWTFVDCQGNPRDPYLPRPCSEAVLGGGVGENGEDEHVESQALPGLHSRNTSVDLDSLETMVDGGGQMASAKPMLTVSSMDGFFFVEGDAVGMGGLGTEMEKFQRRKIATIVKMCLSSVLRPGVVVVTGQSSDRVAMEGSILNEVEALCGGGMDVVRVELRDEKDKEKVNGHQSQIRGGLFKAIDDFNNPNNNKENLGKQEGVLVIVCKVNETGQYMLRELLETNGDSRTHRYAIRKDRVLFVVTVDDNAELQEMTISRAHALIHCPKAPQVAAI